ncbi:hypothetical protein DAPPUDRAFT_118571 [Daphnia pulex]|uniref:Uncharacterized protein n=1 Tax=Daphnia pulex TaxID=6669 RepID=E9HW16_DAPPU|nr:hypothetical protein DAPPUDRAFT_118571 [Daphnia pulex]|eukprot:EFX64070.1 hypothetical protein DAPPUDRAFT_118571 [Daphnia pulex]
MEEDVKVLAKLLRSQVQLLVKERDEREEIRRQNQPPPVPQQQQQQPATVVSYSKLSSNLFSRLSSSLFSSPSSSLFSSPSSSPKLLNPGSIDGDPATTITFSGATAVDAVATYVSQSAITFNHNDGIGYPASTALHPAAAATTATTRNAATAFDPAASGCQPATAGGSGDTEPEPPTATNAAPS